MTKWKLLTVALTLYIINTSPCIVKASEGFEPTVLQVETIQDEHLSEPVDRNVSVSSRSISIVGNDFVLDGNAIRIVAGSLHYFRVPAAYWQDRLHKLKQAGLNTVTTYVEWSYHEPEERQYNFSGDRDVARFFRIAAEEGLHVILRVGPYICGERDLGGLPYWLLGKYPGIKLRSTDQNFINESKIWMDKIFGELSSLLYGNGGPIILVQVENEYGSYGADMAYKLQVRDMIRNHVGSNAILFTTDGPQPSTFMKGSVPGALTTIDFSYRVNVSELFRVLREHVPQGPLMNSEYYTGWLTHWGERLQVVSATHVVETLGTILDNNGHVNFYMFFGGSNFEYMSGANYGGTYQPDITSYDYDSPLTEAGDVTPKYFAIRDKLKQYNLVDESLGVPGPSSKGAYGKITLAAKVGLLTEEGRRALGKKYNDVTGATLPTFEDLRQRGGLVLYETTVDLGDGLLRISKPRDMIFVFVDGVFQGRVSRMQKIYSLPIVTRSNSVLSLLVENQGRINYGDHLHDHKGILSPVVYGSKILDWNWSVTGYPLEVFNTSVIENADNIPKSPTIYETEFTLPAGQTPLDTFLDTTGWGKGFIWINGHNLGRYWPTVGPQVTLYVPGVWLNPAPQPNHLQILELDKPSHNLTVEFIDYPILDRKGNIRFWR